MALSNMSKRYRWVAGMLALAIVGGVARSASGILVDLVGQWSAPLIAALEARGVIAGDVSGRFHPDAPLARAEMAKLLVVGLGNEADAELLSHYRSRFDDIPNWHWAKGYIESLAESAITEGYSDGTFGPSDIVTRAQMAVFLVRAAGLAQEARLRRFESTSYHDDRQIPEWARGSVHLALSTGLMSGFEDQTFRPDQPITRAEGGVTLLRLLEWKGLAYHMTGTLVRFNLGSLQGVIRDALGQEKPFTMVRGAQYFRDGVLVAPTAVQPLDQAWIILGPDGTGRFMDARYKDLLATNATVEGQSVRVTLPDGNQRAFPVQTGALVFVNGRVAPLAKVNGAPQVYLALDQVTGEARVVDAVDAPIAGEFVTFDTAKGQLLVKVGDTTRLFSLAADLMILLNGERRGLESLVPGDRVRVAVNDAGAVVYLQAER